MKTDIYFFCPRCGQHLRVPESWCGEHARCGGCGSTILVPLIDQFSAFRTALPVAPSAPPSDAPLPSSDSSPCLHELAEEVIERRTIPPVNAARCPDCGQFSARGSNWCAHCGRAIYG